MRRRGCGRATRDERENCRGHRDAVVAAALDVGSFESVGAPFDVEPVGAFFARNTECVQDPRHGRNAVTLFVSQLFGVPNARRALRPRGKRAGDRDLVDCAGYRFPADRHCPQWSIPRVQFGHWFTAALTLGLDGEAGTHIPRNLEQTRARRIDTDAARGHARPLDDLRGDQQKRRRRDVAGDLDLECG